jgi:hypothetical protein
MIKQFIKFNLYKTKTKLTVKYFYDYCKIYLLIKILPVDILLYILQIYLWHNYVTGIKKPSHDIKRL